MPVTVQVGDVMEVRMEYQLNSDRAFNLLHYQAVSVIVNASGLPAATPIPLGPFMGAAPSAFHASFVPGWTDAACQGVFYTATTVQSLYPAPRSRPFTYIANPPDEGAIASDPLPLQDTATILKRTNFGERWGLGRVFFAGLPENGQSAGTIIDGEADKLNFFAGVLATPQIINDGTYTTTLNPVLFAEQPAGPPRITPITSCALSDLVVKSQKRRRPGKGI